MEFECPVCYNLVSSNQPCIRLCQNQHYFCITCFNLLVQNNMQEQNNIKCPMCRDVTIVQKLEQKFKIIYAISLYYKKGKKRYIIINDTQWQLVFKHFLGSELELPEHIVKKWVYQNFEAILQQNIHYMRNQQISDDVILLGSISELFDLQLEFNQQWLRINVKMIHREEPPIIIPFPLIQF